MTSNIIREVTFHLNLHLRQRFAPAMDRQINARARLAARIAECTLEDGSMYVAESGRDCDGVQYQGGAYRIAGTMIAYWNEYHSIVRHADGPVRLEVCEPTDLPESWSRDLTMEAFEDGHQHVIYASGVAA